MSIKTTRPTFQDINQCKKKIDAYIDSIDQNPEHRAGAYPYYQFHAPGEPIYGTVLMFHGFSAKPDQMWRLSAYLFENGFNVYQCSLAGHSLINPHKNWPQIDLKSEYRDPLFESMRKDPILSDLLSSLEGKSEGFSITQKLGIAARILRLNPLLLADMIKALLSNNDPDFDKYFVSSHLDYLDNARQRLQELRTMPGEIYTVGLSVGGATALALAQDQPMRIKKVVAYAPLLNPVEEQAKEWQVNLIGVLDIKESGWDPNLKFPVGCFSAVNRFGDFVRSKENYEKLKNTPIFLVLTENEDAADPKTNQQFFDNIGGEAQGNRYFSYDKSDLVPHPMIDPTEVSQGMSNHFWQSLYQETYRFLTTGEVVTGNMDKFEQAQDLPLVKPA
ncbi:MAG: alpha/beta hydrolase [Okeania sp. SIO3I5]|uniref:alpha/beta hydrolase n=1 Tax=Okeania sp. SIO3I5 TaxID=2607805 RepID=UPI0013B88F84|nr:alpha/beta fold hydrolase [Okeania sp. SIO3I5]NEQ34824.1 alpha/beta hydrolase [Okeania sp. SIO3I5]